MCTAPARQKHRWAGEDDDTDKEESPAIPARKIASAKELALREKMAKLMLKTPSKNDRMLSDIRQSSISSARVPGISHACNTVSKDTELLVSPADISSKSA